MTYKFCCPIHGNSDDVRVAAVSATECDTVIVSLECLTCDLMGFTLELVREEMEKYDLPEIGSNIYNPLRGHLKKFGESDEGEEEGVS